MNENYLYKKNIIDKYTYFIYKLWFHCDPKMSSNDY